MIDQNMICRQLGMVDVLSLVQRVGIRPFTKGRPSFNECA